MYTTAIIAAGGSGTRCGGDAPKQYQCVAGRPLLEITLSQFEAAQSITNIILVVSADRVAFMQDQLTNRFPKVRDVVAGGASRQESVARGVRALAADACDIVVVHDAARPLIAPALIDACVAAATESGAAIVALPARDTIKLVRDDAWIERTLPRETVWHAQTPQAFRYELFLRALAHAEKTGFVGTDEAALLENFGERVRVVCGEPWNIKITTPEDFKIAEAILGMHNAK